jgi:uncharacterized hydantoinase/oxoprolinase family protein
LDATGYELAINPVSYYLKEVPLTETARASENEFFAIVADPSE